MNRPAALTAIGLVLLAACGDDGEPSAQSTTTAAAPANSLGAQVASYDLAAGPPQRFLVGLLDGEGGVVVGGTVRLDFTFLGEDEATEPADAAPSVSGVEAAFLPVAATRAVDADAPRLGESGESGVYEAQGVVFDRPGFWSVQVGLDLDGVAQQLGAAFRVLPEHRIPTAGTPAPRTVNLLPGDPEAPPDAVDSRAEDDGTVPDPELHRLTVADAIATGKPTLLVVSTPVYCVSRFCGPITDSVQVISQRIGDAANFVHIEVWRNYEELALNRGAAEWVYPSEDVDPMEPWVFLVDGAGTVVQRWDNVSNEAQLETALTGLLG